MFQKVAVHITNQHIGILWVPCLSNPLAVTLSISSLKGLQTLPTSIQNLVYAVSRVRSSCHSFLNLLISCINSSPAPPLELTNSGMAFASTTLHLLSHLWLSMSTTPSLMVAVLTHSGCTVPFITKSVL